MIVVTLQLSALYFYISVLSGFQPYPYLSIAPLILLLASLFVLFPLLMVDPGIATLESRPLSKPMEAEKALPLFCGKCKVIREKNQAEHCMFCDVCIYSRDHHCGILGRCVTRKNMNYLHAWIALVAAYGLVCILACFMVLIKMRKHKKA